MTTVPTSVPDLLRAAATEIDERGWIQHDFVGDAGEVCLVGALRAAAGVHPLEEPNTPAALQLFGAGLREIAEQREITDRLVDGDFSDETGPALFEDLDLATDALTFWNDRDGRTAADVLALLARVADGLDRPTASPATPPGGPASTPAEQA